MNKILIVIGAAILLAVFLAIGSYNKLVSLNQRVDNQWAQVETQYQRRYDLIPNLVKSVEGIMKQEQQIFKDLADARSRYAGAQTVDDKTQAANQIESSLGRLLVVVENYPQLKSNENVNKLMDELAGTENRISVERKRFNDQVTEYNLVVTKVPSNILASIYGFKSRQFFQANPSAQTAPEVNFNQ
jgi:LemA protein